MIDFNEILSEFLLGFVLILVGYLLLKSTIKNKEEFSKDPFRGDIRGYIGSIGLIIAGIASFVVAIIGLIKLLW